MQTKADAGLNLQELANLAQARAAFYAFLSVHFTTLPDAAFVERIRDERFTTMLEALVKDESAQADLVAGASLMRNYLEETSGDGPLTLAEKLGIERTRLYRGLTPSYGPPPPYEMVWSREWPDLRLLQALAATYRENGLAPSPSNHERLDYIGVELDFIRELAAREAAAWAANTPEEGAQMLATQQGFLNEHVQSWVPAFVEKALQSAQADFYRGHLLMLRGFLAGEQRDLQALVEETQAARQAPVAG